MPGSGLSLRSVGPRIEYGARWNCTSGSSSPSRLREKGEYRRGREAQEPAAGRGVAQCLPREAQATRTLVVGHPTPLKPPYHPRRHVIDEILSHPRQCVRHLDAVLAQHLGPADSRQLEQLRRVDRSPAEHDLARRRRLFLAAVAQVADPRCSAFRRGRARSPAPRSPLRDSTVRGPAADSNAPCSSACPG